MCATLLWPVGARTETSARFLMKPGLIIVVRNHRAEPNAVLIHNHIHSVSQPSDFDPNEALTENDAAYPPASPPGDLIRLEERPKPSAGSKSKASRPMSISVPPAKDFFLASNSAQPTAVPGSFHGNQDDKQSPASSTCHRRARSMTIPQKPGSPRSGATVNVSMSFRDLRIAA